MKGLGLQTVVVWDLTEVGNSLSTSCVRLYSLSSFNHRPIYS